MAKIRSGKKQTHWMWFIFQQITEPGNTATAHYYAIKLLHDVEEYLRHPVLGNRLRQMTAELLKSDKTDAYAMFGFTYHLNMKTPVSLLMCWTNFWVAAR